jgi:outer membrane protein TolC
LNAELDLATDHAGRVAIRRQIVEQFKTLEKVTDEQFKNVLIDRTDVFEAKAARLQAEIDLLLEMADGK